MYLTESLGQDTWTFSFALTFQSFLQKKKKKKGCHILNLLNSWYVLD